MDTIHDIVQQGQKPPKRLHSIAETAEILGIGMTNVRLMINAKKLAAMKIGNQYRISNEEIDRFTKTDGGGP